MEVRSLVWSGAAQVHRLVFSLSAGLRRLTSILSYSGRPAMLGLENQPPNRLRLAGIYMLCAAAINGGLGNAYEPACCQPSCHLSSPLPVAYAMWGERGDRNRAKLREYLSKDT